MFPTAASAEHPDGFDKLRDLAWFAAFVAAYAVVDLTTRAVADLEAADADRPLLLAGAVLANPVAAMAVFGVMAVAIVRSPQRALGPWSSFEQGAGLRLLVAPLIVILVWQGALQPYDYHLDQTNGIDRLLLVGLGAGALVRPALLLPFVAQQRILATPLTFPFGTIPGRNIDELLVIVLAVLAGASLLRAVTRRDHLSPALAVIIAAVATHFFVPGLFKARSGWLLEEDLRNLPPNAYTAGWLGQTDGSLSTQLSDLLATAGIGIRLAVLALELGALVAALHHRLFRWWLVPAVLFHVVNFVLLGYWFLGWILVEIGLIVFLGRPSARGWLDENVTWPRAAAVALTVAFAGTTLFHPPRLSWFDSPVGEGYRIEAVGESGAAYHVPFAALAPFEEDLAFNALTLGTTSSVTGPYGVAGEARLHELEQVGTLAMVDELREPLTGDQLGARDRSEAFLADWLDRANTRASGDGPFIDRLWSLRAPTWFWTGRPEPTYRFDEPIRSLRVERITSLRTGHGTTHGSTTVLTIEVDQAGTATVVGR